MVERLQYVLSHGCKEGLVERLQEWPGVRSVQALMEGKPLEGWWFDRTQEYLARRRGEDFGPFQYATRETLEIDPLPCWKHLTPEQRQKRVAALVSEIEAEAAIRHERTPIMGKKAIGKFLDDVMAQYPGGRMEKFEMQCHDIEVSGDWGSEWCTEHQIVRFPGGKPPFEGWGKMLFVLHRGADSKWRVKEEMWNQAVASPAAAH